MGPKLIVYAVLLIAAYVFGTRFYESYNTFLAQNEVDDTGDIMDVETPNYTPLSLEAELDEEFPIEELTPQNEEPQADPSTPATDQDATSETTDPPDEDSSGDEAVAQDPSAPPPPLPPNTEHHLGLYGAAVFFVILALGLMAGRDISAYAADRANRMLFNDEGEGMVDSQYEAAEVEWAKGEYLEAIRLLREYLKSNPRGQHAALRIAEIYEKDMANHLAAALEYEEILTKKLPRERWGWAAIHLANLYSGQLGQPDKAVAVLRRLESEYGETAAANKARQRLALIDGGEIDGPEEGVEQEPPADGRPAQD